MNTTESVYNKVMDLLYELEEMTNYKNTKISEAISIMQDAGNEKKGSIYPKCLSQKEIYKAIFNIERTKQVYSGRSTDNANRKANIYAVKHTVEAWKRQQEGKFVNLFNPRGWDDE